MNSLISRRRFFQWSILSLGAVGAAQAEAPFTESHVPDPGWPALTPDVYPERCQMTGVAVAADGSILVLNHGDNPVDPMRTFKRELIKKPAVLVIDPKTGKLVRSWGKNLFMRPHQINVDGEGHVWVTDSGLKRVFKFDVQGNKLLEIGGQDSGLALPTDVVVLSDGTIIVGDGAPNKRGVKFDASGKNQGDWGLRGAGKNQVHTPHSLAVDEEDLVYVADKENHWVQVLNAEGAVEATWRNVGGPLAVRYQHGLVYVLSNLSANRGIVRIFNKQGEPQGAFHTRQPRKSGKTEDYEWPHGLAVSEGGDAVYVGFILTARRVQRYRRVAPAK